MCQMSVVLERDGEQETILENATLLEVVPEGVNVNTLFEPPKLVPRAMVKKIDFLSGTVTLAATGAAEG